MPPQLVTLLSGVSTVPASSLVQSIACRGMASAAMIKFSAHLPGPPLQLRRPLCPPFTRSLMSGPVLGATRIGSGFDLKLRQTGQIRWCSTSPPSSNKAAGDGDSPTNNPNKYSKISHRKPPSKVIKKFQSVLKKIVDISSFCILKTWGFMKTSIVVLKSLIRDPKVAKVWWGDLKQGAKHMWHWIKTGSVLYFKNVRTSSKLVKKQLQGKELSLREHKLLIRTTTDLFKLVPFSLFIIIPFAELLLPFALRLFPSMLPSTFNEKAQDLEAAQRRLRAKREMAKFFQTVIAERNKQILHDLSKSDGASKQKADELVKFQKLLLNPDEEQTFPSVKEVLTFSKLFQDEFKLENMQLEHLQTICHMLGMKPYGFHSHVVLQLRHYVNRLKNEDKHIMWEGVDELNAQELRDVCRARGMPHLDVSEEHMRDALNHWLALSSNKDIPVSLLLWSRTFYLTQDLKMQEVQMEAKEKKTQEETQRVPPEVSPSELFQSSTEKRKEMAEEVSRRLAELEKLASDAGEADNGVTPEKSSASGSSSQERPKDLTDSEAEDEYQQLDKEALLKKMEQLREELELQSRIVRGQEKLLEKLLTELSTVQSMPWMEVERVDPEGQKVRSSIKQMLFDISSSEVEIHKLLSESNLLHSMDKCEKRFYPADPESGSETDDEVREKVKEGVMGGRLTGGA